MASDPQIQIYDSGDITEGFYPSFGMGYKEGYSKSITLHIWNNKDGTEGTTASNVTITTSTPTAITDATVAEVVSGKWLNVKCTSFGDESWTAVGGVTTKAIGYDEAMQTIPYDEKAIVETKLSIPATATAGWYTFSIVIAFDY